MSSPPPTMIAPAPILSVQSSVAYGHVGNSAAVFALRRTGREVWPVDTVAFSNHPGYGRFAGRIRPAAEVRELFAGLREIGALARCHGVLSGYLGSAAIGEILLDAVGAIKAARGSALYCCDPVMGDEEDGLYVPVDLVHLFTRRALAVADVVVPNAFELGVLCGQRITTVTEALAAARHLLSLGPQVAVITSLSSPSPSPGVAAVRTIGNLAVSQDGAWFAETPRLDLRAKGTGDVLAALVFANLLDGISLDEALAKAVSAVFAVVEATVAADATELRLVCAQDGLVAPRRVFPAQRLEITV